jgi:membrane protein required for colicin V production
MTDFDWVLVVCYALAWIHGIWRGLVLEVMALTAWVVGFILAPRYAHSVVAYLPMQGASAGIQSVVGFVTVLIATLVLLGLLARLLHGLVDWAGLGWIDRFLGGLFSVVKTTVVCLCLTFVVNLTPLKQIDFWRESHGAKIFIDLLAQLKPMLPIEYGKYVN